MCGFTDFRLYCVRRPHRVSKFAKLVSHRVSRLSSERSMNPAQSILVVRASCARGRQSISRSGAAFAARLGFRLSLSSLGLRRRSFRPAHDGSRRAACRSYPCCFRSRRACGQESTPRCKRSPGPGKGCTTKTCPCSARGSGTIPSCPMHGSTGSSTHSGSGSRQSSSIRAMPIPAAPEPPHSVLTLHLCDDDPEGPTRQAEARVMAILRERLGVSEGANPRARPRPSRSPTRERVRRRSQKNVS
jgi:hypothetical protein